MYGTCTCPLSAGEPKLSSAHIRPVFVQSVLECIGRLACILWQCIPTITLMLKNDFRTVTGHRGTNNFFEFPRKLRVSVQYRKQFTVIPFFSC